MTDRLGCPIPSTQLDVTRWEALAAVLRRAERAPAARRRGDHGVGRRLVAVERAGVRGRFPGSRSRTLAGTRTTPIARRPTCISCARSARGCARPTTTCEERLLATGWSAEGMEVPLARFRLADELFREDNVPLLAEDQATAARYGEIVGGLTVEFDGRGASRCPRWRRTGRHRTARSARLPGGPVTSACSRSATTWTTSSTSCSTLRGRVATNAGFDNYRDYRWRHLGRFDYTPEDAVALPGARSPRSSCRRWRAWRQRAPGRWASTELRPWDVEVDPHADRLCGRSRRRTSWPPRQRGSSSASTRTSARWSARCAEEDLLDLDNRKGKAPGGYCATLSARARPFIFMNAVGTDDNVRTMLHEAGHALPRVRAAATCRSSGSGDAPMEFAEVASMTMELLTSPYLDPGRGRVLRSAGGDSVAHHAPRADDPVPAVHGDGRRVPALAVRTTRTTTPRRGTPSGWRCTSATAWTPTGRASRTAGAAYGSTSCTSSGAVLLHRVRHRPARRAAGLAQQPVRSRWRAVELPIGSGAGRHAPAARALRRRWRSALVRRRDDRRAGWAGRRCCGRSGGSAPGAGRGGRLIARWRASGRWGILLDRHTRTRSDPGFGRGGRP